VKKFHQKWLMRKVSSKMSADKKESKKASGKRKSLKK